MTGRYSWRCPTGAAGPRPRGGRARPGTSRDPCLRACRSSRRGGTTRARTVSRRFCPRTIARTVIPSCGNSSRPTVSTASSGSSGRVSPWRRSSKSAGSSTAACANASGPGPRWASPNRREHRKPSKAPTHCRPPSPPTSPADESREDGPGEHHYTGDPNRSRVSRRAVQRDDRRGRRHRPARR